MERITPGKLALSSTPVTALSKSTGLKAAWKKTMATNSTRKMKIFKYNSHFKKLKYDTTPVPCRPEIIQSQFSGVKRSLPKDPENHKPTGFLSNTGPDALENHKTATKPAFNVEPSSAHQRNAI